MDDDGDGLERMNVADGVVTSCIDGDGTVIAGSGCPCDPRLGDGYSVSFRNVGVPARIVGYAQ